MVIPFVALDARGKATKSEPEAAIVGILRVDAAGEEAQAVAICGIRQTSRPVASVARLIVQSTIAVAVEASAH